MAVTTDGAALAWAATIAGVGRRPKLWGVALTELWRLRRPRWWANRPFLPVPDRRWVRWRLVTAYGDPAAVPAAREVVDWLEWRRRWSKSSDVR